MDGHPGTSSSNARLKQLLDSSKQVEEQDLKEEFEKQKCVAQAVRRAVEKLSSTGNKKTPMDSTRSSKEGVAYANGVETSKHSSTTMTTKSSSTKEVIGTLQTTTGSSSQAADEDEDVSPYYDVVGGAKERGLTEEQLILVRTLDHAGVVKVVQRMAAGQDYAEVLRELGKDLLDRMRKAAADQYGTITEFEDTQKDEDEATSGDTPSALFLLRSLGDFHSDYFVDVARVVPLRLRYEERYFLRLLESALEVSEYTDKIDVLTLGNKARRIAREIKQVCAILTGLVVAHDYETGQKLVKDRTYRSNMDFFRAVFEIGRRYKILNPERMRSSYGKLMYLLMDSRKPEVEELLEFDCVIPVNTVYRALDHRRHGLQLLRDPLVRVATMEIMPENKNRYTIDQEIRAKEDAIKNLARKYSTKHSHNNKGVFQSALRMIFARHDEDDSESDGGDGLTAEEIEQCMYSLGDHSTFLRFNREPCEVMIEYLKTYFCPHEFEPGYPLGIEVGRGGARLTHNHSRQYQYVLHSLTLWKEIANDMFLLWHLAEQDMLCPANPYQLLDTGQGLNRLQRAPSVTKRMYSILNRVQRQVGGWIGSSTIHLGDRDVPNALMFIDKYTQVPRILGPVVLCLEKLPQLYRSRKEMQEYIDALFGGLEGAIKKILADFFKHAFDGSGADNFLDAGSCIDGRLTSAWNWCSKIEKKPYYPLFQLTGFIGFDGRF